jgi:phage terminase large subunit-like protein
MPRDYIRIANQYINDVLSGEIPACQYVRQAAERQRRDLARKAWPYTFDTTRAAHVCKFVELLPHIKGEWAGRAIILEPWQIFILTTTFGWIDGTGRRRFKTCYTEVPRKNAKSTISSGVALYCLTADGEGGAEVYSAATTRDQARIVWEDARRMVERCAGLREKYNVQPMAHSIIAPGLGGTFKALSRDQGGNLDGLNVHCAIVDELHAHKTREVWDVLETATGARRQPLIWGITTAGFNRVGICYEQRTYTVKLLNGTFTDEEYFGIIYTIDDADEWSAPESWQKANPNWGKSVNPDDIARKARKALEMTAAQNNFLTKHLNVWVNADTAWMDLRAWQACADPELLESDFEGEPCWAALDLASKTDIAAYIKLFERDGKIYLFGRYYLPESAATDGRSSHYAGWAKDGYFTLTDGNITDFEIIENDVRQDARRYEMQAIGFDPWQAQYMANNLQRDGLKMYEYRQTVQNMSEPMKTLEAWVKSNRLRHNNDPVLNWMVSNVVAHTDAKENIYPRREMKENKIDGVVAALMAIGEYLTTQADGGSVYEEQGIREI